MKHPSETRMVALNIASGLIAVVIGTGATTVYATMQKATPVSNNAQWGVGGASTLFTTIHTMETYPHMSYPRALTYGAALTAGFYGVGCAIGAGLSLMAENKSRHEDV